ncbi:hypothetical protein FRC10_004117 [Ceratobasidium sp. 414]|nr:hypothetical protein FRC10_004117 [Ceratobasidium sp. 414]
MALDACDMCKEAGIEVDPVLAELKVEEEAAHEVEQEESQAPASGVSKQKPGTKQCYPMTLGMAEYNATQGCLVNVIDCKFNNPQHTPCIEVGGCMHCFEKRHHQDTQDTHLERHGALKLEAEEQQIEEFEPEPPHKRPATTQDMCTGAQLSRYIKGLQAWRHSLQLELLERYDISKGSVMTNKELRAIARFKQLREPSDFDKLETQWPARDEWHLGVLQVLARLQEVEDSIIAEQQQVKEANRLEKQRIASEKAAEKARKDKVVTAEKAAIDCSSASQLSRTLAPAQNAYVNNIKLLVLFV